MSQACRKLVACDKVVPCKSAFRNRPSHRRKTSWRKFKYFGTYSAADPHGCQMTYFIGHVQASNNDQANHARKSVVLKRTRTQFSLGRSWSALLTPQKERVSLSQLLRFLQTANTIRIHGTYQQHTKASDVHITTYWVTFMYVLY